MKIPLRVLIIEDSEDDALLIIHQLERAGYKLTHERVETKGAMLEALEGQTWDIIVSDYKMPHFSGLAALKLYQEKGLDIPFIIVSGTIGEEIAAAAMVSGAHDYVMKNNLSRLVPSIQRELREAIVRQKRDLADKALKESEQSYKTLSKNLPAIVYRVHIQNNWHMQFFNDQLQEITGYTPDELTRGEVCSIDPFIVPEDRENVIKTVTNAIINRQPFEVGYRFRCRDGSILYFYERGKPIYGNDGEPAIIDGVIFNITEHKQAEEKLHQSEEKYRSIFENAMVGIFQSTPDGRIINANPALARLHGFTSPEELMKAIKDVRKSLYVNPDDRNRYMELLEKQDKVINFETQFYRSNKDTVWVSMNIGTHRNEHGEILYYEGIVEDISSRKQAEEDLKQTMEKLKKSLAGTIHAMSLTVETRDPYTAGHQRKVSNLAYSIAKEMVLPNDTIDNIRIAGIIHDIGKISIPAEILSKPTKLTAAEFSLIKAHSQTAYDILKDVGLPYPIAEIVLQHHERLDGSGYPQGLKGDQILLEARIIAVADVVEAISSHRPYRPGFGIDVALEEIEKNVGVLYDRKAVEICLKLFREKGFSFE